MMVMLVILSVLNSSSLPSHWKDLNRQSIRIANSELRYIGRDLISSDGKFLYSLDSRMDLETGVSRKYVAEVREERTRSVTHRTMRVVWMDGKSPISRWRPVAISQLFYGKQGEIGCVIAFDDLESGYFVGEIGRTEVESPLRFEAIKRLGLSWWFPVKSSEASLRSSSIQAPAIYDGLTQSAISIPKALTMASGIPNGIVPQHKLAYFQSTVEASKSDFGFGVFEYGKGPNSITRLPKLREEPFCFYAQSTPHVLADGSFCLSFIRGNRHNQNEYGTAIYKRGARDWVYYEGLEVCGTSSNGKFVAYSNFPWRDIKLARISD